MYCLLSHFLPCSIVYSLISYHAVSWIAVPEITLHMVYISNIQSWGALANIYLQPLCVWCFVIYAICGQKHLLCMKDTLLEMQFLKYTDFAALVWFHFVDIWFNCWATLVFHPGCCFRWFEGGTDVRSMHLPDMWWRSRLTRQGCRWVEKCLVWLWL